MGAHRANQPPARHRVKGEPMTLPGLLLLAIALLVMAFLLSQCRKPRGLLGRFYISSMNRRHAGVTAWGLGHVPIEPASVILDIGCGGGKAIERLAAVASQGTVQGVDYSPASVAAARFTNARAIAEGRVDVRQASVSALPFADDTFDLVTAVETHYYWPEPSSDLRQVFRVLKPGGSAVIIAETYRGETFGVLLMVPMALLRARYLTVEEHRSWLDGAGLVDVVV